VVLLATPPGFRPLHIEYAVEQGKHVFAEKPVATDPVGVRRVLDACKKAKEKGLAVVSGLCYRYQAGKQDTIQRLHDGAIGDVRCISSKYWASTPWYRAPDPNRSPMENQLNNWYFYVWLSGDQICEQAVHSIDKCAWIFKDEPPARVVATGGRAVRTDPKYGNIYDHFNTVYEFENGVKCFSSCRQWENSSTDVSDFAYGTKGIAEIQTHKIKYHDGGEWKLATEAECEAQDIGGYRPSAGDVQVKSQVAPCPRGPQDAQHQESERDDNHTADDVEFVTIGQQQSAERGRAGAQDDEDGREPQNEATAEAYCREPV